MVIETRFVMNHVLVKLVSVEVLVLQKEANIVRVALSLVNVLELVVKETNVARILTNLIVKIVEQEHSELDGN